MIKGQCKTRLHDEFHFFVQSNPVHQTGLALTSFHCKMILNRLKSRPQLEIILRKLSAFPGGQGVALCVGGKRQCFSVTSNYVQLEFQ